MGLEGVVAVQHAHSKLLNEAARQVLGPLGLSVNRMSMDLHVPVTRMNDIARGRRSITADTALRLGRYFSTGAQFWVNPSGPRT